MAEVKEFPKAATDAPQSVNMSIDMFENGLIRNIMDLGRTCRELHAENQQLKKLLAEKGEK